MKKLITIGLLLIISITSGCSDSGSSTSKMTDEEFIRAFLGGVIDSNESMTAGYKAACESESSFGPLEIEPGISMSYTIYFDTDCSLTGMSSTMTYNNYSTEGVTINGSLSVSCTISSMSFNSVMSGTLAFSGYFTGTLILTDLTIDETGNIVSGTVTYNGTSMDLESL